MTKVNQEDSYRSYTEPRGPVSVTSKATKRVDRHADGVTQSSSGSPATFSLALKSPPDNRSVQKIKRHISTLRGERGRLWRR